MNSIEFPFAALRGRIDWLKGLKENVVLGGYDTRCYWIQGISAPFKQYFFGNRKEESIQGRHERYFVPAQRIV